jgi:DNA-binding transcriptional regulator LsrR (DeoR family)
MSIDKEIKGGRGNKLYSPENCCWASSTEQQRNKRNNRIISHDGETLCLFEWAERVGLSPSTIQWRLDSGWTVEAALFTAPMVLSPEQKKEQNRLRIEQILNLRAQGLTFTQVGEQLGLHRVHVSRLLRAAGVG